MHVFRPNKNTPLYHSSSPTKHKKHRHTERERDCEKEKNLGNKTSRFGNQGTFFLWKVGEGKTFNEPKVHPQRRRGSFVYLYARRRENEARERESLRINQFVSLCLLLLGWLQAETELTSLHCNMQIHFYLLISIYLIFNNSINIFYER